jgi:hypothetical protein
MKLTPLDLIKIEVFNNDKVSRGLQGHMKLYLDEANEDAIMSILVFIDEVIYKFNDVAGDMTHSDFKTSLNDFMLSIYMSSDLEDRLLDRVEERCKQLRCDIDMALDSYHNSQMEYNISKFIGVSCELMDHITILHKAESNINHILKHVMMRSRILDAKARYNNVDVEQVYDRNDFISIYTKYLPNIYEILEEECGKTTNEILEAVGGKSKTVKDDGCSPLENMTDEEREDLIRCSKDC